MGDDNNDPVTKAILSLLDHASKQDAELALLKAQLAKIDDTKADAELAEAFASKKH